GASPVRRSPVRRRANGRAAPRPQRSSPPRPELQPNGSRAEYRAVQTMRFEELRGGHRLAARALHAGEAQYTFARTDVDARGAGGQHFAGSARRCRIDRHRLPDAQLLTVQARFRDGPWVERANLSIDLSGRLRP